MANETHRQLVNAIGDLQLQQGWSDETILQVLLDSLSKNTLGECLEILRAAANFENTEAREDQEE